MGSDREISKTLAERAAETIRSRIIDLAPGFGPGDRLYPARLAADLGISSTPVREAFGLLTAEGFVVLSPRRGATVFRPAERELEDLMEVQEWLELLATRLVAIEIRSKHGETAPEVLQSLAACGSAIDACEQAIERVDATGYRAENTRFHRLLIAASGNGLLVSLYDSLIKRAQLLSVYYPWLSQDVRQSILEHRALLSALSTGDRVMAEAALHKHWAKSRVRVLREYEGRPTDGTSAHRDPNRIGRSQVAKAPTGPEAQDG